jgi:zinc transport system ATP-binding protein
MDLPADSKDLWEARLLSVVDVTIAIAGRPIVRNASFALQPGASLAIIGPNGSGKTLLLKALMGLMPYSGRITWKPGSRLGYVPQNAYADPNMPLRVRELLQAKAKVQHLTDADIEAAVGWVGVQAMLDKRLGSLSSGQFQRVLVAFAMLGAPDALLVDEPTSSLDEPAEEHVFELMRRARQERGITVILVSHDLTLVRDFATHVLCLSGGAATFGSAEELLVPAMLARVYGAPVEFHAHSLDRRP